VACAHRGSCRWKRVLFHRFFDSRARNLLIRFDVEDLAVCLIERRQGVVACRFVLRVLGASIVWDDVVPGPCEGFAGAAPEHSGAAGGKVLRRWEQVELVHAPKKV